VNISPHPNSVNLEKNMDSLSPQNLKYPATRYMGAKGKLLPHIWNISKEFTFESVLDMFSGSGVVSYMFKSQGKRVISNDYMHFSSTLSKAMVENKCTTLSTSEANSFFESNNQNDLFVQKNFQGLYFSNEENELIDIIRSNIKKNPDATKQSVAMSALIRACFKKRPRGIFSYVGYRYDDGRNDLSLSLQEHFLNAVELINNAIFDNGRDCISKNMDAMQLNESADLIYLDPPYYSPLSDNEYVRRYHFVEGLARDWKGVELQMHTKTKKFKSYPTPFSSRAGTFDAFKDIFKRYRDSIIVVSYSSNSYPTQDEILGLLKQFKTRVEVVPIDHKYSIGNRGHLKQNEKNQVQEYLFIGF
jgi:DNA adenine methylase